MGLSNVADVIRKHRASQVSLLRSAAAADSEIQPDWEQRDLARPARVEELRSILESLVATSDVSAFKTDLDAWSRRPGPFAAFRGFGQMWVNQVVNYAEEDGVALASTLADALSTPTSVEEAEAKFDAMEAVVASVARNGHPAKARVPFVLSLFWSTDPADDTWPCLWPTAFDAMNALGWTSSWPQRAAYRVYREVALISCPDHPGELDRLLWWFQKRGSFVGLSPTLPDLCSEAVDLMSLHDSGAGYPDEETESAARSLAEHLRGELQSAGRALQVLLAERTGLELDLAKLQLRTAFDKDKPFRSDAYAMLALPGGMGSPGFRLWVTRSGLAFGAYAGWQQGSQASADAAVQRAWPFLPKDSTFFRFHGHSSGDRLEPLVEGYGGGEVLVGKWWPGDIAFGRADLRDELLAWGRGLAPVLKAFVEDAGPTAEQNASSELAALAEEFKASRPYPTERDELNHQQRSDMAQALTRDALEVLDTDVFRVLINGRRYGNPGPQASLNRSMNSLDGAGLADFSAKLQEFLWGEDPAEVRLDRVLDWDDLGMRGLGESVAFKLLAVSQPERFLPVFPLQGPYGKLAMLKRLGLPLPGPHKSIGAQHIEANDALRAYLEPAFPGDAWAMGQFGYWLLQKPLEPVVDPERDLIEEAADELLVDIAFLREVTELLDERKQVVFYGPPGTGKTFLAHRLARAIQPDPTRVSLVQFHPSTSYEDFFEGYRPRADDHGQLVYDLQKGPLALIAEQAEAAPGVPHVLIIDEINRANLPRAFGELLFLLEYRNHTVRTIYRPEEQFELPKNLLIIGTMNTADRSIALVDAALRRRFDFIPFMPHDGPMEGLLRRWLEHHDEPVWVADIVDGVNLRLVELLRGPHLQIGHSHFMKQGLTDAKLDRIWRYNIYPMIEDQLYGHPNELKSFEWDFLVKQNQADSQTPVDDGKLTDNDS